MGNRILINHLTLIIKFNYLVSTLSSYTWYGSASSIDPIQFLVSKFISSWSASSIIRSTWSYCNHKWCSITHTNTERTQRCRTHIWDQRYVHLEPTSDNWTCKLDRIPQIIHLISIISSACGGFTCLACRRRFGDSTWAMQLRMWELSMIAKNQKKLDTDNVDTQRYTKT